MNLSSRIGRLERRLAPNGESLLVSIRIPDNGRDDLLGDHDAVHFGCVEIYRTNGEQGDPDELGSIPRMG
jgi:hypothetical protein